MDQLAEIKAALVKVEEADNAYKKAVSELKKINDKSKSKLPQYYADTPIETAKALIIELVLRN